MNKLEKLMKEFCPDGVEWKKLGDIGEFYGGITGKRKEDFQNGNAVFITYKNVYNNLSLKIDVEDRVKIYEGEKQRNLQYGDIIFTGSSEKLNECGISSVVTENPSENLYLNSFCFFLRLDNTSILLPDFSKYLFCSEKLRYQIIKTASGVTRFNVSKEMMKKIKIPIPSIEVQEKIVKILDSYTKYITELQEKLKIELQARNRQYNYYRDVLLSEDYLNKISNKIFIQSNNVIHKTKLIEIAKLSRGKRLVRSELHENGQYPVFQNSLTPLGYYNNKNFDGGRTCIITAGAAGEIFYQDKDFWAADDVLVITTDDILNKYLYYFLLNKQNLIKSKVRKASVPRLSRDDIEKIEVLLPPIEIQNKIVKILDRFHELLSDTKGLLPLEIEQRRKQYEYYREKLLTFDVECSSTHARTHVDNI